MAQIKKPGYDKRLKIWTFVIFKHYDKVINQDWFTVSTKAEIREFKMHLHSSCLYTGFNIEFTAIKKTNQNNNNNNNKTSILSHRIQAPNYL